MPFLLIIADDFSSLGLSLSLFLFFPSFVLVHYTHPKHPVFHWDHGRLSASLWGCAICKQFPSLYTELDTICTGRLLKWSDATVVFFKCTLKHQDRSLHDCCCTAFYRCESTWSTIVMWVSSPTLNFILKWVSGLSNNTNVLYSIFRSRALTRLDHGAQNIWAVFIYRMENPLQYSCDISIGT